MDFKFKIKRTYQDNETLGDSVIINDLGKEIFNFKTLELPWLNNQHGISCIAKGEYDVIKVPGSGNIPYPHFAVKNVAGRSGICIHIGNYAAGKRVDSKGCILVGNGFADINKDGNIDVTGSTPTLHKLLEILPDDFTLIIE